MKEKGDQSVGASVELQRDPSSPHACMNKLTLLTRDACPAKPAKQGGVTSKASKNTKRTKRHGTLLGDTKLASETDLVSGSKRVGTIKRQAGGDGRHPVL